MTLAMIGSRRKGLMFWKVQAMPILTMFQVLRPTISFPMKRTLPASGFRMPVISRSKRGLASAVRPDQTQDLIPFHGKTDIVDSPKTAEVFGESFDFKEGLDHIISLRPLLSTPCAKPFPRLSSGARP